MPVLNAPPYVNSEYVLNLARVLCLDAGISIVGDLLADTSPGIAITAASQTLLVVTITTSQAHGLTIGQVVNVLNVGVAGYNGLQTVQTTPALNQFTYVLGAPGLAASSGGSVSLSPSQAFILLNSAYQYVQDEITNQGYETQIEETVLKNVTPVPASVRDTATQVWIGYDAYFDGLTLNTTAINGTPQLPIDLLAPLVLKERVSNLGAVFYDMGMANDGLTKRFQYALMREWEWRGDRIYMVGATQTLDIWMRYQAYFPELTMPTDMVKIFHGANAVAYTLANRFSSPRMGDVGGHFTKERDQEIKLIVMRSAHKNQRKQIRRNPYGGGHSSGWNYY